MYPVDHWRKASLRHPDQIRKPTQFAPSDTRKQRLYFRFPADVWAPHSKVLNPTSPRRNLIPAWVTSSFHSQPRPASFVRGRNSSWGYGTWQVHGRTSHIRLNVSQLPLNRFSVSCWFPVWCPHSIALEKNSLKLAWLVSIMLCTMSTMAVNRYLTYINEPRPSILNYWVGQFVLWPLRNDPGPAVKIPLKSSHTCLFVRMHECWPPTESIMCPASPPAVPQPPSLTDGVDTDCLLKE